MRLPIASSIESRDGTLAKDAKLVNCFVDMDGDSAFVVKRPGLLKAVASAAGAGLGMVSWEGNMYQGVGATIYQTSYASIPSGSGGGSPALSVIASPSSIASLTMAKIGSTLYVLDEGTTNKLHSSSDGGVSWTPISSDTPGYFGTCPLYGGKGVYSDGVNLYGIDSSGDVRKSTNGGVTWTIPGTPNYANQSFIFYTGTQWFQVGGANSYSVGFSSDFITYSSINLGANCPRGDSGIVYVGGKYIGVSNFTTGAITTSTDGTTWNIQSGFGWTVGENVTLHTDGTSVFMFRHSVSTTTLIIVKINPSTLAFSTIYTDAEYSNNSFGPASKYSHNIGSDIIVFNGGQDGYTIPSVVQKFTAAGDPWVSPGQTYAFTTATPGLPLSWVGTSPGTYTKKMFIKNTEKAWTLTLGTPGTLTQVTDADYPAVTVPGAVYLDGYFFVMDKDGTVYNCDLENPDSWNALNYITAEAEWDKGVAIAKHQNYVVALKDWTTELFYDAANPTGSPLAKVANAAIQLGCAQGYSVTQFHGGLVFMSKTREKGRSVHVFPVNGIDPQEIATPAIQRILNAADLTSVSAWGGKIAGRVLYVLNLVTANITLVYDFSTQTWVQWTSDTAGTEGHFLCGFYATDGNRDYLLHESTGDVFSLTMDAYQDNGENIKVLARTGRIDAGNLDRKTMRALSVVGDQAETSVTVQASDDDYQTFSAARMVSLASLPARLTRLGMFRRRSFDVRHVDNTPLRLLALDAEIEQAR